MRSICELTSRQQKAFDWVNAQYGRKARARLLTRPEELPIRYRDFWRFPFGILEWNEHIRIDRRLLWQGKIS